MTRKTRSAHLSGAYEEYSLAELRAASVSFLPYGTALYASFAILDALYIPDGVLMRALLLRCAVTILMGACVFAMKRSPLRRATVYLSALPALAAAISVAWMSAQWDRGSNGYGAGIPLPTLALGFLTRRPHHTLAASGVVLLSFVTLHLLPGPLPSEAVIPFVANASFVAGAGLLATLQSFSTDEMRYAAFEAKRQVEQTNASLEEQVLARTAQLAAANEAFFHFVPAEFLRELGYDNIADARLGDACVKRITVMFADLRKFTTLVEGLEPAAAFSMLNRCLACIGPPVRTHGGFVDKYLGDAVLALFPQSPADAVRAAVNMQNALAHPEAPRVSLGIGIHVGRVMMGTIGEEGRFEATVIADAVNLASRLESFTRQLDTLILVSGDIVDELDAAEREDTRSLGHFIVKGKKRPTHLFEIFAADPSEVRARKRASRERFAAALDAYRTGDACRAVNLFSDVAASCAEDGPARWWLRRAEQAAAAGAAFTGEDDVSLEEK